MATPVAPPCPSNARRDLLALAALGLLAFAAARRFDLFARLVEIARHLEGAGGDALIVAALALAVGLAVYPWHRWWEARRALGDRIRAEGALRTERDFADAVMATVGSLIVVLDRRGRIVRFNRACEALTGYALGEVRGCPFWEILLLPDEAARVRAVFADLCAGRYPNAHENHWVARDGTRHLIAWRNTALLDAAGAVTHVVATGIDVTARRAAEADLCASEARLRLLTRQLPAFLWTTDADLRLTAFSGGGFRRGGIDPRGRVGQTVAAFFGVDDPAFPPLAAHRRALGGAPNEYPLRRDGRDYEVRVEPLRDAAGAIVGTLGLGVDVTERERTAAQLRDSEARFRAIFEHAAIGIGLADLGRRPLMVNPALARLTGHDGDEVDGHGLGRSTHPEDAARDNALFAALVAGRRDHYQIEKRYVRPDGGIAWGRLTTSLVRDVAGAPQYAIGMVEDITGRVTAESNLREQEARYRAVIEQADEGIFLFDATTKHLVEVNPAFCRLLGYTESEGVALCLHDIIAHNRVGVDTDTARVGAVGQFLIGERDYRRKDGSPVPVEISATRLAVGDNTLVCVVIRDVTSRREAQFALRASEARLQAVMASAPTHLFTFGTTGNISFTTGRGLTAPGYMAEVIDRPILVGDTRTPEVADYVRRALTGEMVEARIEVDGLVFAARYAPLQDESGVVTGVIGVVTDVTAWARAEAERDEARRHLVASREIERALLARELHDGPVQDLIAVRYQLLAQRQPPVPSAALDRLLDTIGQLRGVITDLRLVGLEDSGLPAALEEYAAQLRRDAGPGAPAILLTLDPAGHTLPTAAAPCLFRVAQEAVRNAFAHARARLVQLTLEVSPEGVTLRVEDDGCGFDVPPRLETFTRRHHFGLVGLVERMEWSGGEITIASVPGAGSTITARLPCWCEKEG